MMFIINICVLILQVQINNFVGKGMGETNNFGPGWTKEKPTTNTETLPNRKFEVKLPTVTLNIPK